MSKPQLYLRLREIVENGNLPVTDSASLFWTKDDKGFYTAGRYKLNGMQFKKLYEKYTCFPD